MRWPWTRDLDAEKKELETWAATINVDTAIKRLYVVLDRADATLDEAREVIEDAKKRGGPINGHGPASAGC